MNEVFMTTFSRRVFIEAGIIFCVGVVLGLSFNTQLVMDAFSGKIVGCIFRIFQNRRARCRWVK